MNYVIKMSASFRMLWVRVRGRWSIQGENKVYVFRRTFLFLTLGAGCRGGDKLGSSPWTWRGLSRDAARAQHLLPCCHSLAPLSVAQCPHHCRQGPSAQLPFCGTAGTDGVSLRDTVATSVVGGSFYCLGWWQSWAVWGWSECELGLCSRSVFLASVTDLGN